MNEKMGTDRLRKLCKKEGSRETYSQPDFEKAKNFQGFFGFQQVGKINDYLQDNHRDKKRDLT